MSGERSARAARWSPEEDAALRELWAEHASTWDGWSEALPGRTAGAIMQRAKKLRLRTPRSRPGSLWTREQDRQAVLALRDACERTGMAPAQVLNRLRYLLFKARGGRW